VAVQLTLGQYTEAATSAYMMTSMKMQIANHHHVNAFSPPLFELPLPLAVTIRDGIALLRDIADTLEEEDGDVRVCVATARGLVVSFERGTQLRSLQPYMTRLLGHCVHVLTDCEAFLSIRALLCAVRKAHQQRDAGPAVTSDIRASYNALQSRGIEGRSDYVVASMAQLDIAMYQGGGETID